MVSTLFIAASTIPNTQLENSSLIAKIKKEKNMIFYLFLSLATVFILINLYEGFWKYKHKDIQETSLLVDSLNTKLAQRIVLPISDRIDLYKQLIQFYKSYFLQDTFDNHEITNKIIDYNFNFLNNYYRSNHAKICALLMSLVIVLTILNLKYTKAAMYQTVLNIAIIISAILIYEILLTYFKYKRSNIPLDKVFETLKQDYPEIKIHFETKEATEQKSAKELIHNIELTLKQNFDNTFNHKYMNIFALVDLAILGAYTFVSYHAKQEKLIQTLPTHILEFVESKII